MPIQYAAGLKTTRMTDVKNAIDAGSGPGFMEICSAAYAAVLATITLSDPCGVVTGDTLNFTFPHSDLSADNSGTAALARIKDSDGNVVAQGLSVGTAGSNVNLSSVNITAGQPVTINSGAIQHS